MKNIFTTLKTPALISILLVLPFMGLELINRQNFRHNFPILLFGMLWLLPVIFILVLMPIERDLREGYVIRASRLGLLARIVVLLLLAGAWVSMILDRMPCFLGMGPCD